MERRKFIKVIGTGMAFAGTGYICSCNNNISNPEDYKDIGYSYLPEGDTNTETTFEFQKTVRDIVKKYGEEPEGNDLEYMRKLTALFKSKDKKKRDKFDKIYLDICKKLDNKIKIIFSKIDKADHYQIRVLTERITNENWDNAVPVDAEYNVNSDTVETGIVLKPHIYANKCTGCEVCLDKCPNYALSISGGKAIIDYDKCSGCEECYKYCPYYAVSNSVLGRYYYFAVKGFSENEKPVSDVRCTLNKYTVVYENNFEGDKCCGFCGKGCYVLDPHVLEEFGVNVDIGGCPYNAVYIDQYTDSKNEKHPNAIFIDRSKCVNCGICMMQCGLNNGKWSVRKRVVVYKQGSKI